MQSARNSKVVGLLIGLLESSLISSHVFPCLTGRYSLCCSEMYPELTSKLRINRPCLAQPP